MFKLGIGKYADIYYYIEPHFLHMASERRKV